MQIQFKKHGNEIIMYNLRHQKRKIMEETSQLITKSKKQILPMFGNFFTQINTAEQFDTKKKSNQTKPHKNIKIHNKYFKILLMYY